MLEAASGRDLARLVRQRIIQPLHLADTVFPTSSPDIAGYHAHGYTPPSLTGKGYQDVTRFAPSLAWAAGAVISTADDLHRFYAALLGGRLLRPALLRQMQTTVDVLPVLGYGLGLYSSVVRAERPGVTPGTSPATTRWLSTTAAAGAALWSCCPPIPIRGSARCSSSPSTPRCAKCSDGYRRARRRPGPDTPTRWPHSRCCTEPGPGPPESRSCRPTRSRNRRAIAFSPR